MALPKSITQAEFEKVLIPVLDSNKVKYNYISGKKHFGKNRVVSLYEKELKYKEGSDTFISYDYVFVLLDGMIYQFKHRNPPLFKVSDTHSPCWKGEPSELNFGVVPIYFPSTITLAGAGVPATSSSTVTKVADPLEEANQQLSSLEYGDSGVFDIVDLDPIAKPAGEPFGVIQGKFYPVNKFNTGTSDGYLSFIRNEMHSMEELIKRKSSEYHRENNPYYNFDGIARMNQQIPERVLWGVASKQIFGCLDLIKDIEKGNLPAPELVAEKVRDSVLYLNNLHGLILRTLDQHKEAA